MGAPADLGLLEVVSKLFTMLSQASVSNQKRILQCAVQPGSLGELDKFTTCGILAVDQLKKPVEEAEVVKVTAPSFAEALDAARLNAEIGESEPFLGIVFDDTNNRLGTFIAIKNQDKFTLLPIPTGN